MSSPSLASLPPQQGQAVGPAITTRSRGRCAGKGARTGLLAGERVHRRAADRHGGDLVLGRAGRGFLELQLQLVEQLAAALGGVPVLLAPQLGDQQLVVGATIASAPEARASACCRASRSAARAAVSAAIVVGRVVGRRHEPDCRRPRQLCRRSAVRLSRIGRSLTPPLPAARCEPGSASQSRRACRPAAPP